MSYTRRRFLRATGGIAAATLADTLHAQGEPKPEAGATLRVLRWKRFVQGDEDAWLANTKKFTEQTGIEVRIEPLLAAYAQLAAAADTAAGNRR